MSDTPRTDAEFDNWVDSTTPYTDARRFARTLERELAEANKRIKRMESAGNLLYRLVPIDCPERVLASEIWDESKKEEKP